MSKFYGPGQHGYYFEVKKRQQMYERKIEDAKKCVHYNKETRECEKVIEGLPKIPCVFRVMFGGCADVITNKTMEVEMNALTEDLSAYKMDAISKMLRLSLHCARNEQGRCSLMEGKCRQYIIASEGCLHFRGERMTFEDIIIHKVLCDAYVSDECRHIDKIEGLYDPNGLMAGFSRMGWHIHGNYAVCPECVIVMKQKQQEKI